MIKLQAIKYNPVEPLSIGLLLDLFYQIIYSVSIRQIFDVYFSFLPTAILFHNRAPYKFLISAEYPIDRGSIEWYYIVVVSNTEYKSYRIVRGDCVGESNRNAQRRT